MNKRPQTRANNRSLRRRRSDWRDFSGHSNGLVITILAGVVLLSGCQAPGIPWLPNSGSFSRPGYSLGDSANEQVHNNAGSPMRQAANHRRTDVQSAARENPFPVQRTTFQETAGAPQQFSPDPVRPTRRQNSNNNRPQLGTRSPDGYGIPDTGEGVFYAEETAKTIPMSASELVIELGGNLASMRQEVAELRQTMERLDQDNRLLRETRDELNFRLSRLETELADSREREATVRRQFDELGQRMQQYNSRRQNQITELNSIIDQLEVQLKAPPGQATINNPYRNTSNTTEK